jgi:hypothetical protein
MPRRRQDRSSQAKALRKQGRRLVPARPIKATVTTLTIQISTASSAEQKNSRY